MVFGPPRIAPYQVIILPLLKGKADDEELLTYCRELQSQLSSSNSLNEPIRVILDKKPSKGSSKRWGWVRKGAPVILEVGPRDMAEKKVAMLRRDILWEH